VTKGGLISQHLHGIQHSLDNQARCSRNLFGNEAGFDIQVAKRRAQPPNAHSLSTS
jgi:hypothetical protein